MFRGRVRHIHFVGIGGIGMSGLAEILRSMEFEVSGSDLKENSTTKRLASLGVRVFMGHRVENIEGADVVVYSSAVARSNPEVTEARNLGVPVIARAEMLAELMRVKYGVAIAGSHGKTTTTSLVATVLRAAGLDPTVVVGGKMAALGSNASLGAGDLLVAEADESDGSFLRLSPTIAVVTNIDPEHLDHHKTHDALKDAFVEFASRVPFYGLAVLCLDHPHVQSILPRIHRRYVTYGLSSQADYHAKSVRHDGLSMHFQAYRRGDVLGEFSLRMPGLHNVQNALAVIAIADELGVPLGTTQEALATFSGVARRFTIVGEVNGITLVDDYGHHPAEIEATLAAAQSAYNRRVIVAFQPHRYTRTRDLFHEFTRAFNQADVLLITDVYAAGEAPIEGATSDALARAIRHHGHHAVRHIPDKNAVADALAELVQPGDIVIALGAGDINQSVRELHQRLQGASPTP
ncbi:MAG: UDP-N-acetylmuramate--L-alanine ligase [Polyangiaceae bacterium]|jgi:UDP-N-acetylmuramate--alanine ligase|nr:UDP-N-acetylmuramate--L-alanine ligase [Polyangiaceae bacterium]